MGQGRAGREEHCPGSQMLGPLEAQQDRTVVMERQGRWGQGPNPAPTSCRLPDLSVPQVSPSASNNNIIFVESATKTK